VHLLVGVARHDGADAMRPRLAVGVAGVAGGVGRRRTQFQPPRLHRRRLIDAVLHFQRKKKNTNFVSLTTINCIFLRSNAVGTASKLYVKKNMYYWVKNINK